jgi:hypothetical protein
LPPQVGFHVGVGIGAAHIGVDIAPSWFSFVEERHILAPRVHSYFAPPSRNVQLVNVTKNVTNVTVINNRVVDRSINVRNIEKVTKRPVTVHRIVEVDSPDKARGSKVRDKDNEVVLVRPAAVKRSREANDREQEQILENRERREQELARENRERREQEQVRANRKRREQELARENRGENGKPPEDKNAQQLRERQRQERTAAEERQRQEHQSRENTSAEESRKRQEAEREDSRAKARRQQQELQQRQANEQRKRDHSGTAEDRDRGDKPALQQQPSQARQQAPASGTMEDTERRSQRQRRKQPHEEQSTRQRWQTSTNLDNAASPRDRQNALTEPQRSERSVRPNTLSPEERRERQETVRRAGEEDNTKRRNGKRPQQQTQEGQSANPQVTHSN